MALARARRGGHRGVDYWPGFVDALSTLLLAIMFLIWPAISHALAQAAMTEGVEPVLAEDRRKRLDQPEPGAPAAKTKKRP